MNIYFANSQSSVISILNHVPELTGFCFWWMNSIEDACHF